jgi:predicted Fe-Mo cluster-binding NifX family protein
MRIVVSAQGENLEAPTSPVFGRCPTYVFVDTETLEFEAVPNPAMNQPGGAGIQAAQFVVSQGAQIVLTGNLGPNAYDVLQAAGVPGYQVQAGTIRQAVEAYRAGQLQPLGGANVAAHAGMGGGFSMGGGMGRRMGRGMGRGMGLGGGMGRVSSRGPRMGVSGDLQPAPSAPPLSPVAPQSELEELRETLKGLRQQLAETMARIEKLEKGE